MSNSENEYAETGMAALNRIENLDPENVSGVLLAAAFEDEMGVALDSWTSLSGDIEVSDEELTFELLATAIRSVAETYRIPPKRAAAVALKEVQKMEGRNPDAE